MSHIGSTIPCVQYSKQLQCYDKSFATYFCKTHEIKLPPSIAYFWWGTPHIRSIHLNDLSRVAQIIGKCRRRCRSSVHFPAPSLMSATNRQNQQTGKSNKQTKATNRQNQQTDKSNKQTKETNRQKQQTDKSNK